MTPFHNAYNAIITYTIADTLPLAQSNGLPDEAHVTLGEEPTNILEDEEEEDNVDEEDTGHDMEEFSSSTDQSTKPPPGTWASRISQVNYVFCELHVQ